MPYGCRGRRCGGFGQELPPSHNNTLYEYEESLKNYRDWRNVLDNAQYEGYILGLERGRAEGIEKGRAEGRTEGVNAEKRATAIRMLSLGMDKETISQITGLSLQEIEELKH